MSQNCVITRKKFIGLMGLAFLGSLTVFQAAQQILGKRISFRKGNIRIRPANPQFASNSFKKFCQRARFRTLEEAVKSVRNREAFIVYQVQEAESTKRIWGSSGRPDAIMPQTPVKNSSGAKDS